MKLLTTTLAAVMAAGAAYAADPELPRSMVWSAYDLGSSGYAEATGIANALKKNYNTRIRIVPAGTSIGRMLPMVTGKVWRSAVSHVTTLKWFGSAPTAR